MDSSSIGKPTPVSVVLSPLPTQLGGLSSREQQEPHAINGGDAGRQSVPCRTTTTTTTTTSTSSSTTIDDKNVTNGMSGQQNRVLDRCNHTDNIPGDVNYGHFQPCSILHNGSCPLRWMQVFLTVLVKAIKLYVPVHFFPILFFAIVHRKTVRWDVLKKCLLRASNSTVRSTMFLSSFVTLFAASGCIMRRLFGCDSKRQVFLAGMSCGLSLLFEPEGRRNEMMLYCVPRGLEVIARGLRKRGYFPVRISQDPRLAHSRLNPKADVDSKSRVERDGIRGCNDVSYHGENVPVADTNGDGGRDRPQPQNTLEGRGSGDDNDDDRDVHADDIGTLSSSVLVDRVVDDEHDVDEGCADNEVGGHGSAVTYYGQVEESQQVHAQQQMRRKGRLLLHVCFIFSFSIMMFIFDRDRFAVRPFYRSVFSVLFGRPPSPSAGHAPPS